MKLCIVPLPSTYTEDGRGSGGIWRVINAQAKWLPEYGIEIVENPDDADVINIHAGNVFETNKPVVTTNHGMYWTGDFAWGREYWQYNASVIEALRRADVITVPSEWVAYPIRRDMRKSPVVIPHGVDFEEFRPQKEHGGYVLWAKPRVDVVCDPRPVNELAVRVPDIQFWTTFGVVTESVRVIGAMPYTDFQQVLDGAMLWLATARETGDIGSREAMARGIPVLGWDWGSTAELVKHKETGYLARPGDYDDLVEGLRFCLQNRDALGEAARADIEEHCQWQHIMVKYARVFRDVLDKTYPVDVSVVIPTYNYANFLPECLRSVEAQTFQGKMEVIVVDDFSEDDTQAVLSQHEDIRIIRHEQNEGLCAALNTGHSAARGKYIINLDADNLFMPECVETLYTALEGHPWLDAASGSLAMYSHDGNHTKATDWPFGNIDLLAQLNHVNQLTSSSMTRASAFKRLGGYRLRQRKNEDGEFWCRAISAGLRLEQVTQDPVLVYRWHDKNKSKVEGGEDDPDGPLSWNFYYPWCRQHGIMPFASTVPVSKGSWAVRSYDDPHVAVIIPCGPGHARYLVDALDSVVGQTFQNFECIVANDTGKFLNVTAMGHPWVKVVDTPGSVGPAIARNTAIAAAKAPLIVPLDADDMLYPKAIENFYRAWLQYPDDLVYSDCDTEDIPGKRTRYYGGPWSWAKVCQEAIYQDTILFAKQWWETVGGYPTNQPGGLWEDWLFGVKLHIAGIGATYIKETWGVYRHWTAGAAGRSKNDIDNADFGSPEFKARYKLLLEWIQRKEETMPCRGCGGNRRSRTALPLAMSALQVEGDDIVVVYEGERAGSFAVNSKVIHRRKYRVNRGREFSVPPGDAFIAGLPGFRQVKADEYAKASLPAEPPTPAAIKLDVAQSPPVVSFAESIKAITGAPPEVDLQRRLKGNGLAQLGSIKRVNVEALMDAGFDSIEKVRVDLRDFSGVGLLRVKGIGPTTLRQIAEIALA